MNKKQAEDLLHVMGFGELSRRDRLLISVCTNEISRDELREYVKESTDIENKEEFLITEINKCILCGYNYDAIELLTRNTNMSDEEAEEFLNLKYKESSYDRFYL